MEWDVTWEIASEGDGKENGVVRVTGDCTIDALTTFFKNVDNKGRQMIGIVAVYSEINDNRKRT